MNTTSDFRIVPLAQKVIDLAVSELPEDLHALLVDYGPNAVVGGGYLRSIGSRLFADRPEAPPLDIDVFVPFCCDRDVLDDLLRPRPGRQVDGSHTPAADARHEPPVQIIHGLCFWHPMDLIRCFDFTVVQAVLWWEGDRWHGYAAETWEDDLTHRVARYAPKAPNPAGTLLRLERFIQLGFHVPPESLALIAARATEQQRAGHFDLFGELVNPSFFDEQESSDGLIDWGFDEP
jgi:hypothetical protein